MSIGVDNKIYCIPFRAADILVIDPVAGTTVSGYGGYNNTGSTKFKHGIAIDDAVYGVPYEANGVLKVSTGFDAILLDGRADINGNLNVGGELSVKDNFKFTVDGNGVSNIRAGKSLTFITNDNNATFYNTDVDVGGGANSWSDSGWYCALTTDNDSIPNEYFLLSDGGKISNSTGKVQIVNDLDVSGRLQVDNSINYTSGFKISTFDQGNGIYRNILQTKGDDADTLELRGGNWVAGNGLVKLGDNVEIDDNLTVGGDLTVVGTTTINGDLDVSGNINSVGNTNIGNLNDTTFISGSTNNFVSPQTIISGNQLQVNTLQNDFTGYLSVVGKSSFGDDTNFPGGNNGGISDGKTHFPNADGNNYIRGDLIV
eukprot:Awhi_evm1s15130